MMLGSCWREKSFGTRCSNGVRIKKSLLATRDSSDFISSEFTCDSHGELNYTGTRVCCIKRAKFARKVRG